MLCSACQTDNREGRHFCASCGAKLPWVCHDCGFENEPDDAFCGGCGAGLSGAEFPARATIDEPVRPDATPTGERRQVTVLFADLSGYTRLSQERDAEETRALLSKYFTVADGAVAKYGGHVDKHIHLNDLLDLPQPTKLLAIFDAMDSGARTAGYRETLLELIEKSSERSPLVVRVENVHWADDALLDHLAALARLTGRCRMVLVLTSRVIGAASEAQVAAYHHDRALQLVERGLEIATATSDRFDLLCLRSDVRLALDEKAASLEGYDQALAVAESDVQRCRACIDRATAMRDSGRYDEISAALDEAQEVAERHELVRPLSQIHYHRGLALFPLEKAMEFQREAELAMKYAQQAGSVRDEVGALSVLADGAYAVGRMLTANQHFSRCVELAREHGFGRIEAANLHVVGHTKLYGCDIEGGIADAVAGGRSPCG